MDVKLVRRWGTRQPGETVEVDDTQGEWLIGIGHAVRPGRESDAGAVGTGRVHPGTDGPDPAAGGDPTRLRMRSEVKSPRGGERAGRVAGAPRAAGDVTHVRDENLAGPNKRNRRDVPLASGKTLTEELEEAQRELDRREQKRQSAQGQSQREQAGQDDSGQGAGATVKTEDGPPASGESPPGEGRQLSQPKR